ncbi:MAG: DUF192 domain-containing protein [Kiritimatiellae bacterium]|nr:DUF192 domain-containing protein [Kiritimatiellia bacterium]MDD5521459.1 DUF192 domain-containing protein [Kiritimatiellia bacterium]
MNVAALRKNGVILIGTVELAVDFKSRLVGLLGRSSLGKQCAMYLSPCSSVHTFFMRFCLDLIFVSRDMVVKKIVRNVVPGRIVFGGAVAWSVVEMESGWFPVDELKIGDKVDIG